MAKVSSFDCKFFSTVLNRNEILKVLVPQDCELSRIPVVLLLHGHTSNCTDWEMKTTVSRMCGIKEFAAVMPSGCNSFYTDMVHGERYGAFIGEEVPELARRWFGFSQEREKNMVAGLSMGGYGAFKLALRNPQRYAYAASFSGVLDLAQLASEQSPGSTFYDLFRNIFGEDMHIRNTEHDLLHVLETFQGRADTLPKLYQYCGRADFLYGENQTFLKKARELGVDITYAENGGGHEWPEWNDQMAAFIDWRNDLAEKK